MTPRHGLTLVHFSAQLEPCLARESTQHTLNTPLTRATQSLRAPPIQSAQVELKWTSASPCSEARGPWYLGPKARRALYCVASIALVMAVIALNAALLMCCASLCCGARTRSLLADDDGASDQVGLCRLTLSNLS